MSRALTRLGHDVEVIGGPPYPDLDNTIRLTRLESLDLYRPDHPFRRARGLTDLIDVLEFGTMCVGGFPEPLTFSLRAWRELRNRRHDFDIVHDNQCLGYGLLGIERLGLPVVATVHHPIAIDRDLELLNTPSRSRRIAIRRWYAFVRMQHRVARRLRALVTVSENSRQDIATTMNAAPTRIHVVPNGVDPDTFHPIFGAPQVPGRLITTASADVPLKGLVPLLEALARLRTKRPEATLTVVGKAKKDGAARAAIDRLRLNYAVRFVTDVDDHELVHLYSEAELAVVPSLYEGFSLPAVEAMACGVPVVATSAGALPEVLGRDGEAGFLVPPGDSEALAAALERALQDRPLRDRLGECGRRRVARCFSWDRAAAATVDVYRQAIDAC